MALRFASLVMMFVVLGVGSVKADIPGGHDEDKYFTLSKIEEREVSTVFLEPSSDFLIEKDMNALTEVNEDVDPAEKAGKVISVARDLVALGEDVYKLVTKGKPSNVTSYAPVSVIPRVNGEAVDILDTETWSAPVKRTYEVIYTNLYGMDVVKFRYSIIYSYNGSYNGKGAYLTSVQIIPEQVRTLFGFDFTATMKLGGIQNQGTRANPIAAATLLMEYTVSSVTVAHHQVASFFVTGRGNFKKF